MIARVVVEWARIDREFPMQLWGHEYLGTHITIELDRYYIAYNAQQPVVFIQITRENEALGRKLGQNSWRVDIADLKRDGCNAECKPI